MPGPKTDRRFIRRKVRTTSIRKTLQVTNIVIILATVLPFLLSSLFYNIALNQYGRIIESVSNANSLSSRLRGEIYTTIWNLVSGKSKFKDNTQYLLIDRINNNLDQLEKNANSEDNSYLVMVARNALETMEHYVDQIGDNLAQGRPVRENEQLLAEISSVSELLYDVLQKFVTSEVEIAHLQNIKIQRSMDLMIIFEIGLFSSILAFLFLNFRRLNRSINKPIHRLKTMASRIAQGDLLFRVEKPEVSELDDLTDSLNTMASKLGDLMEQNLQKQQNLQKAEMKTLQAQIAPHFMYNTLDTILSLAEDGQNASVVTTTLALSNFFRLSLNKGRDWVSVAAEKTHVESYLAVQKIRYGAILDYEINITDAMLKEYMLKILLQPLVENAIYHGIKQTRRAGKIKVSGDVWDETLVFTVEDNGLGMRPDELDQLRNNLWNYDVSNPDLGFGLYNVFKRIQLYYAIDNGLTVESEFNKGSRVTLRLPIIKGPVPVWRSLSEGD